MAPVPVRNIHQALAYTNNQFINIITKQMEKQRHGCVTAWLTLMIALNSFISFIYLFSGDDVIESMPGVSTGMLMLLAFLSLSNVFFAVMLLRWKKMGFWGFVITSVAMFILNLLVGAGILQSVLGLTGVFILYAILQIKNKDVSTWSELE
jgi:hypothetical protein